MRVKQEKEVSMKSIKKAILALILVVALSFTTAFAQSVTHYPTASGPFGTIYYNLSVTSYYFGSGVSLYALKINTTQDTTEALHPMDTIKYTAYIHTKTGDDYSVSPTYTNATEPDWTSSAVLTSRLTNQSEHGFIQTQMTSIYYGSLSKILTNE